MLGVAPGDAGAGLLPPPAELPIAAAPAAVEFGSATDGEAAELATGGPGAGVSCRAPPPVTGRSRPRLGTPAWGTHDAPISPATMSPR